MAMNNPYKQYQENAILTASPEDLTLMLYNGAIKFLKQAKTNIQNKELDKAHNNIMRAEDIIIELMSTLDMKYEISNNLYSLYDFMYNWLVQANMQKTKKEGMSKIDDVIGLLEDLKNTWAQAKKLAKKQQEKSE